MHPSSATPSPPRRQAAAVCYRVREGRIELLLVRMNGGGWTFPKGGVEADEAPSRAAEREAAEEAGAAGEVEPVAFTTYFHEKRREGATEGLELEVDAFLLEVTGTVPPREQHRDPTWFSSARAERALAERRAARHAAEGRRVVREAVARIARAAAVE